MLLFAFAVATLIVSCVLVALRQLIMGERIKLAGFARRAALTWLVVTVAVIVFFLISVMFGVADILNILGKLN